MKSLITYHIGPASIDYHLVKSRSYPVLSIGIKVPGDIKITCLILAAMLPVLLIFNLFYDAISNTGEIR